MTEPRIEETGHGSWMLVGDLSFTTVPALRGELVIKSADRPRISIDLAGVTRSDSAGLALLIEWLREAEQLGKTITFLNMPAQLQSIARVCGLDGILPADMAAPTTGPGYRTIDSATTTPGDSPAPKSKGQTLGPVNMCMIAALPSEIRPGKARGANLVVLNERRATPHGLISGATRRDGAIFPPSCVSAHWCSLTTRHSRCLVLRKNGRRCDDHTRVNRP